MGWSNDQFDGTLVIPTGATSGARIVLDGSATPASITVYDANDNVVAQMTTNIPHTGQDDGGFYTADPNTGKVIQIFGEAILFGDQTHTLSLAPLVTWQYLSTPNPDVLRLQVVSGKAESGTQFSAFFLDSETTGSRAEIHALSESQDPDDFRFSVHGDLEVKRNILVNGVDQGRGPVDYTPITANTATTTTTETIAVDTPPMTFVDGRAYRIVAKGLINSTVAGDVARIRVRQTGLGGMLILDSHHGLLINVNSGNTAFYLGDIVVNNTGADITDDLVMTYARHSGTGNILVAASATQPAYIDVTDIGLATSFVNATPL